MMGTVALGDIADITSSKRIFYAEYTNEGIPFYRSKEIIEKANGNSKVSTPLFISKDRFNEIKAKFGVPGAGDLLLTSVGTLGIPYIVKPDEQFYFKDGNLTWFRNFKPEIDIRYLTYWLTSPEGRQQLENHAIGSTQKALTIQTLKKLKIHLPDTGTQQKIIAIIDSIDNKIEINRQMNEALEQIGQAIFDEYFIHNPSSKSWQDKKLGEVLEFHYGKALTAKDRKAGNYPVYGSSGVVGYHDQPLVKAPGIIIGRKGNVGSVFWAEDDFYPIDTVFYVTSSLPLALTFFYLKNMKFLNSDAAVPGLNRNQVYHTSFKYPATETVSKVAPQLESITELQLLNTRANHELLSLRGSLLPRLMSGWLKI